MGDRTMLRLAAKRACAPLAQSNLCSQTFVRGWCSAEEVAAISGKVKWFDVKKGFGFISPDDGSSDVFVHQTEIHAPGLELVRNELTHAHSRNLRGRNAGEE